MMQKLLSDRKTLMLAGFVVVHMSAFVGMSQIELMLSDLYEFPNLIMTSVFFFLITLVLFAASKVGIFNIVRVPVIEMIPIAIAYSTMIVLDCLSIEYNARGTHELLKTFTLPLILLLTTMFYKFNYSLKLKLVLVRVYF